MWVSVGSSFNAGVFILVSVGGEVCQRGNSLFPFYDRRDVPEAGRGLHQLSLPVHDRSVVSVRRPRDPLLDITH